MRLYHMKNIINKLLYCSCMVLMISSFNMMGMCEREKAYILLRQLTNKTLWSLADYDQAKHYAQFVPLYKDLVINKWRSQQPAATPNLSTVEQPVRGQEVSSIDVIEAQFAALERSQQAEAARLVNIQTLPVASTTNTESLQTKRSQLAAVTQQLADLNAKITNEDLSDTVLQQISSLIQQQENLEKEISITADQINQAISEQHHKQPITDTATAVSPTAATAATDGTTSNTSTSISSSTSSTDLAINDIIEQHTSKAKPNYPEQQTPPYNIQGDKNGSTIVVLPSLLQVIAEDGYENTTTYCGYYALWNAQCFSAASYNQRVERSQFINAFRTMLELIGKNRAETERDFNTKAIPGRYGQLHTREIRALIADKLPSTIMLELQSLFAPALYKMSHENAFHDTDPQAFTRVQEFIDRKINVLTIILATSTSSGHYLTVHVTREENNKLTFQVADSLTGSATNKDILINRILPLYYLLTGQIALLNENLANKLGFKIDQQTQSSMANQASYRSPLQEKLDQLSDLIERINLAREFGAPELAQLLEQETKLNQDIQSLTQSTTVLQPSGTSSDEVLACILQQEESGQPSYTAVKVDASETVALPGRLQALKGADIYHFVTSGQRSADCGPRAVANALALQDLIQAGQTLSSANQRARAQNHNDLAGENVTDDSITTFATQKGLVNPFTVAYCDPNHNSDKSNISITKTTFASDFEQPSIYDLQHLPNMTANLISNTGGHWFTIIIIKQREAKPIIIHMDTSNAPLADNCPASDFIDYLYHQCLGLQ